MNSRPTSELPASRPDRSPGASDLELYADGDAVTLIVVAVDGPLGRADLSMDRGRLPAVSAIPTGGTRSLQLGKHAAVDRLPPYPEAVAMLPSFRNPGSVRRWAAEFGIDETLSFRPGVSRQPVPDEDAYDR